MSFFFPLVLVCGLSGPFAEGNTLLRDGCVVFHGSQTPMTETLCKDFVNQMVDNAMNPPPNLGIEGQYVAQAMCVELPKAELG